MTDAWKMIEGDAATGMLIVADHASNHVPREIDLAIDASLLNLHIAHDIGVAALARAMNQAIGIPAVLGGMSRLVIDLNREADCDQAIPEQSDGHQIPGNHISADQRAMRIARYWWPYHNAVTAAIARYKPVLLVSLHSFTPELESIPTEARPWEVGILYNKDDRAARVAIPALRAVGVCVGDQLPYSGLELNASMDRHGEAAGNAYLGIEMRQNLINHAAGADKWCEILVPIIALCRNSLAPDRLFET